jgi:hypothetical protein
MRERYFAGTGADVTFVVTLARCHFAAKVAGACAGAADTHSSGPTAQ